MSPTKFSYDTIIIGGGQAGLSTGYFLKRQRRDFVILDANDRIGDAWRQRWDSLRLFTPNQFNGLAGMPFPGPAHGFPTKDEMGNFLEAYAARYQLPVLTGVRVDRLSRTGGRFVLRGGDQQFEADNIVVAMASYQKARIPAFARELDPAIVQLHSSDYRNPGQLRDGTVLIVGAGNSGAEIALEVVRGHPTWLAGRDTGHVPFRIESGVAQLILIRLVLRGLFHRVLTTRTPVGRKARPKMITKGMPLVRVKPQDLAAAGVQRVARVAGVRDGKPVLEDRRVLDVANVIWSTGYHAGFSWIDLPAVEGEEPRQERGVAVDVPGLYFVGQHFLYAVSSSQLHGVGRDAEHVARMIAAQRPLAAPSADPALGEQRSFPRRRPVPGRDETSQSQPRTR
jgi:putative flavoprotein involved in K+ transport